MSDANSSQSLPLGKPTQYVDEYDASLLCPVARHLNREGLGIDRALPFFGGDLWNAYEVSWLSQRGKPQVATGEFYIPCTTPNIPESKSLKLYLNSFNNTRFDDLSQVQETIATDLASVAGGKVDVKLTTISEHGSISKIAKMPGVSIDDCDVSPSTYRVTPSLLEGSVNIESAHVQEALYTNLFKSNCLVTGQPDWGTMSIDSNLHRSRCESSQKRRHCHDDGNASQDFLPKDNGPLSYVSGPSILDEWIRGQLASNQP